VHAARKCMFFFKKSRPSLTFKVPYEIWIPGYTHQALFETFNLALKLKIYIFLFFVNENVEGFKAISNHLG
jgi:hypothetical protein